MMVLGGKKSGAHQNQVCAGHYEVLAQPRGTESKKLVMDYYSQFKIVAVLWSIGKDSTTLLWLVRKAFLVRFPFRFSIFTTLRRLLLLTLQEYI